MSPLEWVAIVQPAVNPVLVMWQLGMDTSHIPVGLEYSRGVQLGIDQGIWMASPECGHERLANNFLSNCRYGAGHCLVMETIVSNSPRDQQDMRLKDFIHIALACKCAPNYNRVCMVKYAKHTDIMQDLPSFFSLRI